MESVKPHVFGNTRLFCERGNVYGLVHTHLGHVPIGRPLASGDRDQSRALDIKLVIAGQSGRTSVSHRNESEGVFPRIHSQHPAGSGPAEGIAGPFSKRTQSQARERAVPRH